MININIEENVQKGIAVNLGQSADTQFLTEEDFVVLGKLAADRGAKMRTIFPSWVVTPINSLDEIPKAFNPDLLNYSSWSSRGSNRDPGNSTLICSLQQVEVISKRVYLVPLDKPVAQKDYESYLAQYGLKPCSYGINYLLALMNDLDESEIPSEIQTSIIAYDPNSIGLLAENGNNLYMHVRRGKYRRVLSTCTICDPLPIHLAVIAEKM